MRLRVEEVFIIVTHNLYSRKLLDEEFWGVLPIEKSKHGIVLKEKWFFRDKFDVKIKQSNDRNKIMINGEMERCQEVEDKITTLINKYVSLACMFR